MLHVQRSAVRRQPHRVSTEKVGAARAGYPTLSEPPRNAANRSRIQSPVAMNVVILTYHSLEI